jgi:hypothetical protein
MSSKIISLSFNWFRSESSLSNPFCTSNEVTWGLLIFYIQKKLTLKVVMKRFHDFGETMHMHEHKIEATRKK